ncbi:MAG: hypothetical protein E6Q98_18710 [Rhodospirillaceae bacterium]|nr:MAG: hypothetical protein E6Q98_18710 [Rhodospirillaceae bacterium]
MAVIGIWLLRYWKPIVIALVLLAVLGLFGVMRLELAAARLAADRASARTTQQILRAEAAEAEVARQKGFVSELTAINQRNAALMASYEARLAAQQAAADATTRKLADLKRSYAAAINDIKGADSKTGDIKHAKQQAAPLSAPARTGLARLWCLQQRQGDFDACPGD